MPKGIKGFVKGLKQTDEHKRKIIETRTKNGSYVSWNKNKSMVHSGSFKKGYTRPGYWNKKGKDSPNWKGGAKVSHLRRIEKKAGRKKPTQCELCGAFGDICFDHNHKTGNFRGWICRRCNSVLGFVKDNSELLTEMAKYLNNGNCTCN